MSRALIHVLPNFRKHSRVVDCLKTMSRHLGSSAVGDKSVGLIVIGDEILKGQVSDSNSHFLCKRLYALGMPVKRISVVPDDIDRIAQEVSLFSSAFSLVITTGGIGPTHDDLTFEGVAKAFSDELHFHPSLVELCKKYFGTDDPASPKLKLARVPTMSELQYGTSKRLGYPLVKVKNVYVFPGVPQLLEKAFTTLEDVFSNPSRACNVTQLFLTTDEASIAHVLNDVNEKYKNRIVMGSYPEFNNRYYKVRLTLEAAEQAINDECAAELRSKLPTGSVINYDDKILENSYEKIKLLSLEESSFGRRVQSAMNVVETALQRYPVEEICVGFNGGKDCTLVLHLVHAVLRKQAPNAKMAVLYVRRGSSFPEAEIFIRQTVKRYDLDLMQFDGRIKQALESLRDRRSGIKAVVMGTRHSDPYSEHLSSFHPTDSDWPEFIRINPILDWTYSDVWRFIRELSLPYCSLYDVGYTSLGSMENTHPNPSLRSVNEKGATYSPAYELQESQSERAGRNT